MMHMRRGADRGHAFAPLAVPGSEMRQAPDFAAHTHGWLIHQFLRIRSRGWMSASGARWKPNAGCRK